jgi:hypothetical protein
MNFGWLRDDTADDEYHRVVLHEFGHALGCIHEHEAPTFTRVWNKQAVYKAFSGPPNNWSKADIDSNILDKYSPKGMSCTEYDPKSIMLYAFPAELFPTGWAQRTPTPNCRPRTSRRSARCTRSSGRAARRLGGRKQAPGRGALSDSTPRACALTLVGAPQRQGVHHAQTRSSHIARRRRARARLGLGSRANGQQQRRQQQRIDKLVGIAARRDVEEQRPEAVARRQGIH